MTMQAPALKVVVAFAVLLVGCEREPTVDEIRSEAPVTAQNAPEVVAAAGQPPAMGMPGESVIADFQRRIDAYLAQRRELAGSLASLPDKATPKQIDANQRTLGALMASGRKDAKVGDIFVPEMQTYVRALVRRVLNGPDGARIRGSLMDENPMNVKIEINGRYPDTVPMSTMPPDVLAALPKLPEDGDLEYRFVGNRLILLDVMSHLIVDFVDNTFDI